MVTIVRTAYLVCYQVSYHLVLLLLTRVVLAPGSTDPHLIKERKTLQYSLTACLRRQLHNTKTILV
jgi:hypothetical protein